MSTAPVRAAMVPITRTDARVFRSGQPGDGDADTF